VVPKPIAQEDLQHILSHTRSHWDELRGQRIFITGGTGFFGCWLLESFCFANRELALDATATVLTRNPANFAAKCPRVAADPAITLLAGDVRAFEFPQGEFGYAIHAATETSGSQSPIDLLSSIVAGTERTLQFAASHGTRRFLLTSSGAVYGRQPFEITHLPETYTGAPDPLNLASAYAEGKRTSELLCALYQQANPALECKIARCWAFCGPHLPLDAHFAIGNFIGDALAGRPIAIGGDGTPRRSYLYGADLAIWLWTMLFRAPALTPINVGSEQDVSILELAEIVAATLAPATPIAIAKQPTPGAPPLRYVPSIERAAGLLNLRPTIPLQESIRRTAAWHKSES
jgi:nucleoside-diphosphate-sugar epimerase